MATLTLPKEQAASQPGNTVDTANRSKTITFNIEMSLLGLSEREERYRPVLSLMLLQFK